MPLEYMSTDDNREYYFLRTRPLPGAAPARFTNLYLRLRGDGFSDVVLTPEPPKFLKLFIEEGRQLCANRKNSTIHGFVMGRVGEKRAGWAPVSIVKEEADIGFVWEKGAEGEEVLKWDNGGEEGREGKNEWAGWMACEWVHGFPQLFWVTSNPKEERARKELPEFCERVQIERVPLPS